jgi:hypothetical protein
MAVCLALCFASTAGRAGDNLEKLLSQTGARVADSLERFSEVRCTEKVEQQKLSDDGKIERDVESAYDYLVIFTDAGGELSLNESRLPLGEAKADKKNPPLLVTNGFATLFLVFHPYYAGSFQFTDLGDEIPGQQRLKKIGFRYIRGTHSPAALALRGREYPMPLSGVAWIDADTGAITRIAADIGSSLEDVGIRTMRSEVEYAPIVSPARKQSYWFPASASVELETPRQHWRNTHVFTGYQWFSVNTEEKVSSK